MSWYPQISSNPHQEDFGDDQLRQTSEELLVDYQQEDYNNYQSLLHPMNMGRNQKRTKTIFSNSSTNNNKGDDHERKIMRRDNERQRRQEMTLLSSSLRSLLPLEIIKGKRSASDHMHEAANYIPQLKSKIEDLTAKRDELTMMMIRNPCDSENRMILVRPCFGGIEIVVRSPIPLSRVLRILVEEGISIIVGVASTKVNGMLIHTIQSEVDDVSSSLALSNLQQKLNVILSD